MGGKTLIYANPAAVSLTGWSRDELAKMKREDLVHPDFRPRIGRLARRADGDGEQARHEFKMLTRDGSARWVDIAEESIELDGAALCLWTWNDVTDQRRDSAVLMDVEQKYTEIFENSVEGICQVDAHGRLASANASLARMLGYASPRDLRLATRVPDQLFVDPRRHADCSSPVFRRTREEF